jgi:hypothetical protein
MISKLLKGTALVVLMLLLAAPAASSQEEPLPDLTVSKSGPGQVMLEHVGNSESEMFNKRVYLEHHTTGVNVGDAPAVFPEGTIVLRNDIVIDGRITSLGGTGVFGTYEGVITCCHQSYFEQGKGSSEQQAQRRHFWTSVRTDNFLLSGVPNATVWPSETVEVITSAVFVSEGTFQTCATVDPDNVVVESDETNNTACLTTVVSARSHRSS